MDEVLEEGFWCEGCGWYETDSPAQPNNRCGSCGCAMDLHTRAKVVRS